MSASAVIATPHYAIIKSVLNYRTTHYALDGEYVRWMHLVT
jgi:hypothetical protein